MFVRHCLIFILLHIFKYFCCSLGWNWNFCKASNLVKLEGVVKLFLLDYLTPIFLINRPLNYINNMILNIIKYWDFIGKTSCRIQMENLIEIRIFDRVNDWNHLIMSKIFQRSFQNLKIVNTFTLFIYLFKFLPVFLNHLFQL